jgi:hypothetical protein
VRFIRKPLIQNEELLIAGSAGTYVTIRLQRVKSGINVVPTVLCCWCTPKARCYLESIDVMWEVRCFSFVYKPYLVGDEVVCVATVTIPCHPSDLCAAPCTTSKNTKVTLWSSQNSSAIFLSHKK